MHIPLADQLEAQIDERVDRTFRFRRIFGRVLGVGTS